jgi:hypothetical protein
MEARVVPELREGGPGLATDVEHERMEISRATGRASQSLSFFNLVLVVYYY